jgi:hypothetical protein
MEINPENPTLVKKSGKKKKRAIFMKSKLISVVVGETKSQSTRTLRVNR